MEAKVCACPMRDFKCDNEKEEKTRLRHNDLKENSLAEENKRNDLTSDRLHGMKCNL